LSLERVDERDGQDRVVIAASALLSGYALVPDSAAEYSSGGGR
jgi:hypothetical protein